MPIVLDLSHLKFTTLARPDGSIHVLTPEENQVMVEINERLSSEYSAKLQAVNHSFTVDLPPDKAKVIQEHITLLRDDLVGIASELVAKLIQAEISLYFRDNPPKNTAE